MHFTLTVVQYSKSHTDQTVVMYLSMPTSFHCGLDSILPQLIGTALVTEHSVVLLATQHIIVITVALIEATIIWCYTCSSVVSVTICSDKVNCELMSLSVQYMWTH